MLVLLDVAVILLSSIIVVTPYGYCLVPLLHSVSHIVISSIPSPINSHIKYHIQKIMKMSPKFYQLAYKIKVLLENFQLVQKKSSLPSLGSVTSILMKQNEVTFKESLEFENVTSEQPPLKVSLTVTQC